MTPSHLARMGLRLLKEKRDQERARAVQKYFKEEVKSLGIVADQQRAIASHLYLRIREDWTVKEAIDFCEIMLHQPFFEARIQGILILERYQKDFPKSLFPRIKGWLAQNLCDNWAAVDSLCPGLLAALLEKFPELVPILKTWTISPNRWVRRAAAVSFIKLIRKGRYLDIVYDIASSLFCDTDELVQKANGWLLREAGKADRKRLEKFLLENGQRIPRLTLRYAIERFEDQKRQAILRVTKHR